MNNDEERKGWKKVPLLKVDIKEAGYEIDVPTISDVAFSLHRSSVTAMIGANGAGKSTTIKAILDELPYLEGNVDFKNRCMYSYVPERPIYYSELTLWEHIEFVASVEQLGEESLTYAKQLLQQFHLQDRIHEFPNTFSKGMQQKGMIALALFTKPDLLIIDEPFMGLDPASTKILLRIIEDEQRKGTGILMCTHILDIAERMCDSFVIIEKGTMKASGTLGEVLLQCNSTDDSLYSCISVEDEGQ